MVITTTILQWYVSSSMLIIIISIAMPHLSWVRWIGPTLLQRYRRRGRRCRWCLATPSHRSTSSSIAIIITSIYHSCHSRAIPLSSGIEVTALGDTSLEKQPRKTASFHQGLNRATFKLIDAIPGLVATSVRTRPLIQAQTRDRRCFLLRFSWVK